MADETCNLTKLIIKRIKIKIPSAPACQSLTFYTELKFCDSLISIGALKQNTRRRSHGGLPYTEHRKAPEDEEEE